MNRAAADVVIDLSRTHVDERGYVLVGAHRGEHVEAVYRADDSYLDWALSDDGWTDMPDDVRDELEALIETGLWRPARREVAPRGRGAGSTMRPGDTVEIAAPLPPRFPRAGTRALVADVKDSSGDFVLQHESGARTAFKFFQAANVAVVERAKSGTAPVPAAPSPTMVAYVPAPAAKTAERTAATDRFREALRQELQKEGFREGPDGALVTVRAALQPSEALDLPPLDDLPALSDLPRAAASRSFELPPLGIAVPPSLGAMPPGWTWTDEQRKALDEIAAWASGKGPRMMSLSGYAGTGKTSLIREAIRSMPSVYLAAMTGKAALRLRELTDRTTSTLHAVLYKPPEEQRGGSLAFTQRRAPTGIATLVTDEASLATPQIYSDLEEWAALGTRILLVGDHFQLPPILTKEETEIYGEDFTVFERVKGPVLTRVMRAAGGVLAAATHLRETGRVQTTSVDGYRFVRSPRPIGAAVNDYLADREDHVLITWRNELRLNANRMIRARLGFKNTLPERGEPVLIRQNQGACLNGEIVIADRWSPGPTIGGEGDKEGLTTTWLHTADGTEILTLPQGRAEWFDGGRPFIHDWPAWRCYCQEIDHRPRDAHETPCPIPVPVSYGYCLTSHASQGSEWRRVTVFLGPGDSTSPHFRKPTRLPSGEHAPFSVRFLYTSLTRARAQATLYVQL